MRPAPYVDTPLPSHRESILSPPLDSNQPQLNLPWDPYADQNDSHIHYREEGGYSSAGSISSIASSGQDEELDLGSNFEALGPRFAGLARLYAGDDVHQEGQIIGAGGGDEEGPKANQAGLSTKERLHGELIEELNRRSVAEPKAEWRVGLPPAPSPRPSSSPSPRVGLPPTPSPRPPSLSSPSLMPSAKFSQATNAEPKSRISSSDYSPGREETFGSPLGGEAFRGSLRGEESFRGRERRRLSLVLEHPWPDESWV